METAMLVLTIAAALAFNVTSGFHDAAEICTPGVVTRAIRPAGALALFAVMVFIGPFLVGTAVADTIGGFVSLSGEDPTTALGIVAAGIGGAAVWNVVTWRFAIPSSSTHALVGGLVGVTVVAAGPGHVCWGLSALADGELEGVTKILVALVLSPIAGVAAGFLVFRLGRLVLRRATRRANRPLRRTLVGGTGLLAFAHGGNEAQKGMGVIALALVLSGQQSSFTIPLWVVAVSAATLVIGGVTGGWGIARTLGYGIYRLEPLHAAGAQAGAAGVICAAALLGGPVSTTQVVASSITGAGAAERPRGVRWDTGKTMILVWLVTFPAAAAAGLALFALVAAAAALVG
jgi:PiT family inorganic phosphate transporter